MRPRNAIVKTFGAATIIVAVLTLCSSVVGAVGFYAISSGSSNTFSAGTLQLEGVTSPPCYSTGSGSGGTVSANYKLCTSGSPVPSGTLSNTTSLSASTALDSVGKANALSAQIALASCGPPEMVDTAGADTALAYGALTFGSSGPLASTAITTNGSSGWAETTTSYTNPENFTILAWFKTTGAGTIIGMASQANPTSSTPTTHDRDLWVDNSGKLVWGTTVSGTYREVTSGTTLVNTGNWVFAAASIGTTSGMVLFVNGTQVGSTATYTTGASYAGWWSFGYTYLTGRTDAPTSPYFNGSIAQVAVIPSQLTAAQVTALHNDTTLSTYTAGVNALSPTNYWPLNDTGTVPYKGAVPNGTASTTVFDASGNANTGTAEGGTTFGAAGPTTLSANGLSFNGSTGWVQTTTSYANPNNFSVVAWFKTATAGGTTGGSILGFTSTQGNGTPTYSDRMIWLDNSGKLVWAVFPGVQDELTSTTAYNDANWHMVVAEIGAAGQELWVDGTEVASNSSVTSSYNYTGYWHLGWAYQATTPPWTDPPTNPYLTGSLSEVAVIPSQLSGGQVAAFYSATSTGQFALDVAATSPTAYWPMQDSASNICGTIEVTVQATAGATTTCVYPAGAGACAAPSATYLLTGLGVRSFTPPIASTPVTINITMKLTAAAATTLAGLQLLPSIAFATTAVSGTVWAAQISYPAAMVLL
jgi:hypothetical protein